MKAEVGGGGIFWLSIGTNSKLLKKINFESCKLQEFTLLVEELSASEESLAP